MQAYSVSGFAKVFQQLNKNKWIMLDESYGDDYLQLYNALRTILKDMKVEYKVISHLVHGSVYPEIQIKE